MRSLPSAVKPANGFSYYAHIALKAVLPLAVLVFVRINFLQIALALVLLSKWRMLVIRPRYWLTSVRSNAVDIIVGLSLTIFMAHATTGTWQVIWAVLYGAWLILLKPRSNTLAVATQALTGQIVGMVALFIAWPDAPILGYIITVWLISYMSARHFFTGFDEPYGPMFAHFWAYFAAALMWVLSHWLLFYGDVSQPTLLLGVLGFGLGGIYYLDQTDRLSQLLRRNFIFTMVAIVVVVIALSDWGDKTL